MNILSMSGRSMILAVLSTMIFLPCLTKAENEGELIKTSNTYFAFSAGSSHTCFLNSTRLICWGDEEFGNCNPPDGNFHSVSCGSWHTCVTSFSGQVKCFGSGYALHDAPPSEAVVEISAGFANTCAILRSNSTIVCWGRGIEASNPPSGRFTTISVGTRSACALREADGVVECWGADEFGQVLANIEIYRISDFFSRSLSHDNCTTFQFTNTICGSFQPTLLNSHCAIFHFSTSISDFFRVIFHNCCTTFYS